MWTAPRVNGQLQHPQRYAVTSVHALRHGALQSGRRRGIGRSLPAGLMWTAPRVNGQLQHPQRYAVTSVHALRHGALQSGRRRGIGRSLPAGLSGWMTTFRARGPKRIPQVRYAVTAGPGARRSVPHQAPARRVHGTPLLPPLQFSSLTDFSTVRSRQGAPGARLRAMAFCATRDGHASRRSSSLARCKA
jgi:hypothetical protein